jgi:outer membrane receptor protein involved in Fe transport
MRRSAILIPICDAILLAGMALASIFGSVHGLVHDPQHRPVEGAEVTIRAADSNWTKTASTNQSGEFVFDSVPLGNYQVTVNVSGFTPLSEKVTVASEHDARLHFSLAVANAAETVEVTDQPPQLNPQSSSASNVISRQEITSTPGADQTNSLSMITAYTPGAVVVHDQLHIRGGHQVSWLLDGVPVPNTSIASNVGPQFDPKDIDYMEVQRGGYDAEYGDRTYGVFNVVTRSGFERNRQAEIVGSYGSYNSTYPQISFGDHSDRFAYYGSLSGYRTDLGLETPSTEILHDEAAGLGGFGSLIFNKTPNDQLRLVASVRGDHYQVPNTPDQQALGIRDVENEGDAFANFTWLHTIDSGTVLTISPFYHFNRAHYIGGFDGDASEAVVVPDADRGSNYIGGVVSIAAARRRQTFRAGLQVFGQRDNQFFGLATTDGSNPPAQDREILWGNVETVFVEDQFRPTNWLTFNGGLRLTHYGGAVSENAADPRIGAALRIPKLGWVARGFYGRYYQPPPLLTVSGPILDVAAQQGFEFLPLHGERDEQVEAGLSIPIRGWTLDIDGFRTAPKNYFDHDALGNSNIFFPLTLQSARIKGWEASASSPKLADRLTWRMAFSHQFAQWSGDVTGGLITGNSCEDPLCYLDHDQRNTLSTGFRIALPWRSWSDFNVSYGSGFLDGDGPAHLPDHTTCDLTLGKDFGENWSVRVTALNLTNNHYLLDNSSTFGGTHYANPREISAQVKYRFRY